MDQTTAALLTVVGSGIVTVATGLGTVVLQLYRESRNHTWEREERAELAAKLKADNAALAEKLSRDQAAHALVARTAEAAAAVQTAKIVDLVTENTALTKDVGIAAAQAYAEANDVNVKIAKLGLEHNELQQAALHSTKKGTP